MSATSLQRSVAVARGAVLLTPVVAMVVCAPWHLTRFSPPKIAVAFMGVLLALVSLGRRPDHGPLFDHSRSASTGTGTGTGTGLAIRGWWLLVIWGAVSGVWSPAPAGGLAQWLLWLLAGLWALVLAQALADDGARGCPTLRRTLAWMWLAAAALAAGLALVQRGGVARLGLHAVTSTLGNPNRVAVVMVLCLPLALHLATKEKRPSRRILAWTLAALLVAAVFATGCRAAVLALGVQALFYCATLAASRRFRAATLSLMVTSGVLIWAQAPLGLSEHLGASHAVAGRAMIARVSVRVMAEQPVHGVGLGGYPVRAAWVQGDLMQQRPALRGRWSRLEDAHNQVLMVGAELGVVGLAALVLMLAPVLWSMARRRHATWPRHGLAAWIGLGICSITETTLLSPVVVLLAFGWLVLGSVGNANVPPVQGDRSPRRSPLESARFASARFALVLLLAALGATLATSGLLASYHLGQGLRNLTGGPGRALDLTAAQRSFDRGLAHWGAGPQLRFQRALVRRELGDLVGAAADMRRSFVERPGPDGALILGDLYLAQGDSSAALSWYRRAVALHPRYQRAYNNLGVALLRQGRPTAACRHFIRARSLRPADPTVRRNVRLHCSGR